MRITEWHIQEPKAHVITVEHGFWSGKAIIRVDDQEVFHRSGKLWDTGLEHRFEVDGVPCIVRVINRLFSYTYELWLDGKLK